MIAAMGARLPGPFASLARAALYRLVPDRLLSFIVRRRMPRGANLEATTECNLECPLCPTHYVPRSARFLAAAQVQDVVDSCAGSLREVCFHIQGEPTVHPDLFGLVRRCAAAGVESWFGTNGMFLHRHQSQIFESGLHGLSIDIDGANAEDYQKYRKRGDFDKVVANVKALVAEKRRRGSDKPVIQVQTIMFSYNEANQEAVEDFLAGLGADRTLLKRPSYAHDIEYGKRMGLEIDSATQAKADRAAAEFLAHIEPVGADSRFERSNNGHATLYRERRMCPQLERASVLADGRVVACCMDALGMTTFGDLNDESFADIWRGERHRTVIDQFLNRTLNVCEMCTLG